MLIESKLHKRINGNIGGEPFDVVFDSDGRAEVEEVVGDYLLRLHAAERISKVTEEKKADIDINAMTSFIKPVSVEAKNLSDMSLGELKAEASRLNIKLGIGKTQKQIIAKIEGSK